VTGEITATCVLIGIIIFLSISFKSCVYRDYEYREKMISNGYEEALQGNVRVWKKACEK
jgi:hypothetical protein